MSPAEDGARVLIVEDDESISLGLKLNLEAEGFIVETAADGEAGLRQAQSSPPDLMILDVMLPRQNGFEVVRQLRHAGAKFPVIILSARSGESEKVMGLELGAEDYITKPFGVAELLARVRANLRRDRILRAGEETPSRVVLDDLVIDAARREVHKRGELLELTATEFDVLWCLVAAAGQVLSREEIQTQVWGPGHHGTLRTIDNFLLQLRAKLEDDPSSPTYLLTVRGVGYRFGR